MKKSAGAGMVESSGAALCTVDLRKKWKKQLRSNHFAMFSMTHIVGITLSAKSSPRAYLRTNTHQTER